MTATALISPWSLTLRTGVRPIIQRSHADQPVENPHDRIVRVSVGGALDVATAPSLSAYLIALVRHHPVHPAQLVRAGVELDFSGLSFMDSTGLIALSAGHTALAELGWTLCVTAPQPSVIRLLQFAVRERWVPASLDCAACGAWPVPTNPIEYPPPSLVSPLSSSSR